MESNLRPITPTTRRPVALTLATLAVVATVVGVLIKLGGSGTELTAFAHRPEGVMSTQCSLTAVARADQREPARKALSEAEAALRDIEGRMSVYIDRTELARFNAARAGVKCPLSALTMEVLRTSRDVHRDSGGAFDITVFPLVRLWKQAGKDNRLPVAQEVVDARNASTWEQIELLDGAAVKKTDTACVDLGGIAKGYAADRAAAVMMALGMRGGVVDIGGNIRVFGVAPGGGPWPVDIQDPFYEDKIIATLNLSDAAVCTSAHYNRFSMINGKAYSHIIDPNTGWPTGAVASVTVVARTGMLADAWATALAVLGPPGLDRIGGSTGVEAMLIIGSANKWTVQMTPGFEKMLSVPPRPPAAARAATSQPRPGRTR
jgi:thiamine biosynthesis lipoprotein